MPYGDAVPTPAASLDSGFEPEDVDFAIGCGDADLLPEIGVGSDILGNTRAEEPDDPAGYRDVVVVWPSLGVDECEWVFSSECFTFCDFWAMVPRDVSKSRGPAEGSVQMPRRSAPDGKQKGLPARRSKTCHYEVEGWSNGEPAGRRCGCLSWSE